MEDRSVLTRIFSIRKWIYILTTYEAWSLLPFYRADLLTTPLGNRKRIAHIMFLLQHPKFFILHYINHLWTRRESNSPHIPCKGTSPALVHASPNWGDIQNRTEIVGLQSRNNNHYTIPPNKDAVGPTYSYVLSILIQTSIKKFPCPAFESIPWTF